MKEFKIYSITDSYIEYLRKHVPNVYSNKVGNRKHTRKYIGVVIKINEYSYYIPMSSAKPSDYLIKDGNKQIRKSIVPIIRIVIKNAKGENELKGTLRISHMIPVPDSELVLYDIENETDSTYKDLVQNEIIYIRKNQHIIRRNANLMYKQKAENDNTAGYVKSALEYKALEKLCKRFISDIDIKPLP